MNLAILIDTREIFWQNIRRFEKEKLKKKISGIKSSEDKYKFISNELIDEYVQLASAVKGFIGCQLLEKDVKQADDYPPKSGINIFQIILDIEHGSSESDIEKLDKFLKYFEKIYVSNPELLECSTSYFSIKQIRVIKFEEEIRNSSQSSQSTYIYKRRCIFEVRIQKNN